MFISFGVWVYSVEFFDYLCWVIGKFDYLFVMLFNYKQFFWEMMFEMLIDIFVGKCILWFVGEEFLIEYIVYIDDFEV